MRVKILEGHALHLPRGVFHGGIECELTLEEMKGHESYVVILKPEVLASPVLASPESDLKNKLSTS